MTMTVVLVFCLAASLPEGVGCTDANALRTFTFEVQGGMHACIMSGVMRAQIEAPLIATGQAVTFGVTCSEGRPV